MIFDMMNKVITLVEGTVYNIGQINDRNDYKKGKYMDWVSESSILTTT